LARYQVEHITGKISGTEYTPPNCDTLKSNNICFQPDGLCKKTWMIHPLIYYKYKGKSRKKKNIGISKEKDEKTKKELEAQENK
jgi:DNA primase large subunit